MLNFILTIINRLRGATHARAYDVPAICDCPHPILEGTARLGRDGISFVGLRYNSSAVQEMLCKKSGDHVRVRIKDPSDVSEIFVWDDSASPAPCWLTVGIADASTTLSFANHAQLRGRGDGRLVDDSKLALDPLFHLDASPNLDQPGGENQ